MVYAQQSVTINVGKSGNYLEAAAKLLPIRERHGWRHIGHYAQVMGNTLSVGDRTAYELWEIPDLAAIQNLQADADFKALSGALSAAISKEKLILFDELGLQMEESEAESDPHSSPLYLHTAIQLRRGAKDEFRQLISSCVPIFGRAGWELLASYSSLTGEHDSILDIWKIPSADAIEQGMHDPDLVPLLPKIHANILDEKFTLLVRLPIGF